MRCRVSPPGGQGRSRLVTKGPGIEALVVRRGSDRIRLVLFAVLFAVGCTPKSQISARLEGTGDFSTSPRAGAGIPCELLATDELTIVLNSAIGGSTDNGRPILLGMKMCTVNAAGGRVAPGSVVTVESEASWGVLDRVAQKTFRAYKEVHRGYLDPVSIDGYEATWDRDLRTLIAAKGDRVFGIRLSVGQPAPLRGLDRQRYLRDSATFLTSRALRRMN